MTTCSSLIFTMQRYAVVMCLSVRLSITHQHCVKTAKRRITQECQTIAQEIKFFGAKDSVKFKWVCPNGGAKCRWNR